MSATIPTEGRMGSGLSRRTWRKLAASFTSNFVHVSTVMLPSESVTAIYKCSLRTQLKDLIVVIVVTKQVLLPSLKKFSVSRISLLLNVPNKFKDLAVIVILIGDFLRTRSQSAVPEEEDDLRRMWRPVLFFTFLFFSVHYWIPSSGEMKKVALLRHSHCTSKAS